MGVAGCEQAAEFGVATFAEAFVRGNQQAPRPIQGIVFAAPVTEGVVLDSTARLVDATVGEADHVERIGDLARLGQRRFEGRPVGAGQIQHPPPVNAPASRLGLAEQPRRGARSVATRDNGELLAPVHVNDRGAPAPSAPPPGAPEQRLVQTQRPHLADPTAVGGQQRLAPRQDRPIRGVPVATQLAAHVGDRARVAAHRHRRPASARAVNAPRAGAIRSSTSVNEPTGHPASTQHQRRLRQTRRTGGPNAGRSTNPAGAEPFDHTDPPQPPHAGRARVPMCNTNGPPGASSTPKTS